MAGPCIDRALVLRVARLAALRLSDAEADELAAQVGVIVSYVDKLDALDTAGVPAWSATSHDRSPWRADEPAPGLSHEEALAAAPQVEGDGFAVPPFVEDK